MAAAVSAAGGLGSFGAMDPFQPDGWVAEQIDQIRVATSEPFAVGFITPSLERSGLRFDLVLERSVPVIVLSFSDPQPWLTRAHEAGCKVIAPVMDMFWGDRFGKLEDPFGNQWSMATHKEDVSPAEMGQRAQAFMSKMGGAS